MKSLLIFYAALFVSVNLFAQPFGSVSACYRITRMDYENSDGEKGSTSFKYDRNGILIRSYWYLLDRSKSSVNLYEHNSRGMIVSAWRKLSDGLTSFELFTYDSTDNKTSEYFWRSDSVNGYSDYHYIGKRLVEANLRNYKGWINGTLKYQYNNPDKIVYGTLEKNGKIICNISFDYDNNENLIKEYWDFQGKWNQTFTYIYESLSITKNYCSSPLFSNTDSLRISSEDYTFNGEKGGPSVYFYDDNGLLTRKVFTRSDGFSTQTSYEYDSHRKLISSARKNPDGSITQFKYLYDESNNLILRSFFNSDTLTGFESYLYDPDGTLIKEYVRNLDSWITGSITFFTDETGRISGGNFKGQDGFDAIITIQYNPKNRISEIRWNFTFGKYQKYLFYYEKQARKL